MEVVELNGYPIVAHLANLAKHLTAEIAGGAEKNLFLFVQLSLVLLILCVCPALLLYASASVRGFLS
jgi:hypothetical protein